MISVTKLNNKLYYINPHLIEIIEANPDTTLTLVSGSKLVVKDSIQDIIKKIINYRRSIGIEISGNEDLGSIL